jgi:hypothetical protein
VSLGREAPAERGSQPMFGADADDDRGWLAHARSFSKRDA